MYDNVPATLPREFFYNLSKLQGSMAKNLIKCVADRNTGLKSGNIVNMRLPIGALLDLRSMALWFKVKTTGTNPTFPTRYSSSFIKRMSISINNVVIQTIEDYALLYNLMADHTNKDRTKSIGGDWCDNSVFWSEGASTGSAPVAISGANSMLASTANLTAQQFKINNFLGFLGSTTTPIIPTDRMGEVVISLTLAQEYEVLGGSAEASSTTYSGNAFELDDFYLTCETLSFSDDSYYNSIGSKDLMYGFSDYIVTKFATTTKTAGINCTTYVSANSIDWIAGTAVVQQTAPSTMLAYGSNGDGASANVINLYNYLSDPVTYANNNGTTPTSGDGFFGVEAMVRDLQAIETGQFSINNKQLNYAPLNPYEIFQNNLCALGYEGIDASKNGLVDTCLSIFHYFKYYGAQFQSLSLIDKDQFNISGLSSAGSSCSINWSVKFNSTATYDITPIIVAKLSKVLHVKSGRNISVE